MRISCGLLSLLNLRALDKGLKLLRAPDYTILGAFGCTCYAYLRHYADGKLSFKTIPYVFIGYGRNHKSYKCLDSITNRIYMSRHVVFDEMIFPLAATSTNNLQANSSNENSTAEQVLLGHYATTAMPNIVVVSPVPVPTTLVNDVSHAVPVSTPVLSNGRHTGAHMAAEYNINAQADGSTSAQLVTHQPTQGQHGAQVFDATQNIAPCTHVKLVAPHNDRSKLHCNLIFFLHLPSCPYTFTSLIII